MNQIMSKLHPVYTLSKTSSLSPKGITHTPPRLFRNPEAWYWYYNWFHSISNQLLIKGRPTCLVPRCKHSIMKATCPKPSCYHLWLTKVSSHQRIASSMHKAIYLFWFYCIITLGKIYILTSPCLVFMLFISS